jgi:hypothetical protein
MLWKVLFEIEKMPPLWLASSRPRLLIAAMLASALRVPRAASLSSVVLLGSVAPRAARRLAMYFRHVHLGRDFFALRFRLGLGLGDLDRLFVGQGNGVGQALDARARRRRARGVLRRLGGFAHGRLLRRRLRQRRNVDDFAAAWRPRPFSAGGPAGRSTALPAAGAAGS